MPHTTVQRAALAWVRARADRSAWQTTDPIAVANAHGITDGPDLTAALRLMAISEALAITTGHLPSASAHHGPRARLPDTYTRRQ
ncbi:hypothetical protein GKE82_24455 [Conexibacter sp. W3-3-2]|uniref:hypothetical protein n=1 Tax=Conexibacter sp. W3-3-2 TaxID=2675227 RepID=UPI0012B96177|nr:hypothetical protein [Conexibacter sp. W3-3-2]MTD47362.1 hypothetical protein [Conexibacter sp. W3-3-2]